MCTKNSADERFQVGLGLLKSGQIGRAAELAALGVCDFPDDGPLWELLGVAHQREGRHELAREALETATLLKPLDIGARFCLAEAYAACGAHDLAVFVYRLVSDDPRTPVWLLPRVASHLGAMEEFSHALGVCQLIVHRDPMRHEAHFGIGFYLRRLGIATEKVIAAISRAYELAPEITLYRIVFASLLRELGRDDEAYELLRLLPPGSVNCPHALQRMMQVFQTANDVQRLLDCTRCLRRMKGEQPPE